MIDFTFPALAALVSSLVYVGGMIVVIWRRAYRPMASWALFAYLVLAFVWSLAQVGALNMFAPAFLDAVPFYGVLILGIAFLLATRTFLRSSGAGWGWWLLGLAAIAAPIILDANLLALPDVLKFQGGVALNRQGLARWMLIGGWAVFMGAAVLISIKAYRSPMPARLHTTIPYWLLVLLFLVVGGGIVFAGIPTAGVILYAIGASLAVYVVSVPRLPEVGHLLRQSLSYLIYGVVAVVVYTLSFIVFQLVLQSMSGPSPWLFGIGLAGLVVLLLNPVLGGFQKRVERWIGGESQDPTSILRQYSQSITNILDLKLLATVAAGTLSELLEIRRVMLFLIDTEKGADGSTYYQMRGVKGMGEVNPEQNLLHEAGPLVTFFRTEHTPINQAELDFQPRFRNITKEERDWIGNQGMEVYAPIYAKNEWIGLLALGPKGSGAAFTNEDMALISTLADQTAVALENTRLVEGLVRLNNDFRRAYTALDQANRHLERLDRTKSDFISIASHELRTPLTLITGSSQMLLDDSTLQENAYYKQLLSKIHSGSVRLHEIVDSMLDIAKIDTRDLELDAQPVAIDKLIDLVCTDLRKSATERKQVLEIDGLSALPPVTGDKAALRKVFHHLIINAIKYTPDGGKISIVGSVVEPNLSDLPKGGIEVVVSDTGIGIDQRYQDLIFVKFYQTGELALHSSGKTKFKGGGPGLGLAIARGIVEAHSGKIWVESPGHDEVRCPGSKFHVLLPMRQPESLHTRARDSLLKK